MWRAIPLEWRPAPVQKRQDIENIHKAARLEEALRREFEEGEVEGGMLVPKEHVEREKKEMAKKVRKQQKRLAARMKNKNFKVSTIAIERDESKEAELEAHVLPFEDVAEASTAHAAATILTASPDRAKDIDAQDVSALSYLI